MSEPIVIPDKPAFKAGEVCELLKVPPYVLKSWENEFRDLGVSKTASGPRVYRREDVVRALRIRDLVLTEGLTLAGVRRRLEQESGAPSPEDALLAEIVAAAPGARAATLTPATVTPVPQGPPPEWRQQLERVKDGLRELLAVLSQPLAAAPAVATTAAVARAGSAPEPASPARRRAPAASRRAATPAVEPSPAAPSPVRELVVEPEPVEPSLFGEAEGEAGDRGTSPAAAAGRARARGVSSGGVAEGDDVGED